MSITNKNFVEFLRAGKPEIIIEDAPPETMPFSSSWDWLMLVVEKIESLGQQVRITTQEVTIGGKDGYYAERAIKPGETKKLVTYTICCHFVSWYLKKNR